MWVMSVDGGHDERFLLLPLLLQIAILIRLIDKSTFITTNNNNNYNNDDDDYYYNYYYHYYYYNYYYSTIIIITIVDSTIVVTVGVTGGRDVAFISSQPIDES